MHACIYTYARLVTPPRTFSHPWLRDVTSQCDWFVAERASQRIVSGASILYTYDVEWRESSVQWASRWDVYLSNNNSENSKVNTIEYDLLCYLIPIHIANGHLTYVSMSYNS